MISFLITILVILCFAAWYRYGPDAPVVKMIGAMQVTNWVLLFIALLYFVTLSIGLYQFFRQHRRKSFLISPDSRPWKLLAARKTVSGHGLDCIMAVASRGSISRKRNRRLKR